MSYHPVLDLEVNEDNWWTTRLGFKTLFGSYVDLAYRWWPAPEGTKSRWESPEQYEEKLRAGGSGPGGERFELGRGIERPGEAPEQSPEE